MITDDLRKGRRHVPAELLDRYAAGDRSSGLADVWWAIEAHLESCGRCRQHVAAAVARVDPVASALLDRVQAGVLAAIDRDPPREASRSRHGPAARVVGGVRRLATPSLLPRLAMTMPVMAAAVALDLLDAAYAGRLPSLVLLAAPVAPLAAVAAAWSRGVDPAYELVVGSPRAGLDLVLRRTLVALAVVGPVLAAAGWAVGASPARWLLPCLAFTLGALALGAVIGLRRAAAGLALAWAMVVAGPSLVTARTPRLLVDGSGPGWTVAVAAVAVAVAVVAWRRGYTELRSVR